MSEITCKKELYDFLMYSVFGIVDGDEIPVKKIKCAHRAYRDLARTLRYKYSLSELERAKKGPKEADFKENRDLWIREMCTTLIKSIDMFEEEKKDFDTWHEDLCAKFVNPKKEDEVFCRGEKFLKEGFTYGQAQKWLNMTLKYLWLMKLLPTEILPEYLHVPIDSYILKKVKKEVKDNSDSKYLNITWSTMGKEEYEKLQEIISAVAKNDNKSPVEWEGNAWIEIASIKDSDKISSK